MKNLFLAVALLALTACGGGAGMNFNDGSWSMCTFENKEGFRVSVPMQTALPVGAAHPNGTVLKCEPIAKVAE